MLLEWTGGYCAGNGKKRYREVCPKDPCGHSDHDWCLDTNAGFWKTVFGNPFTCSRCGKTSSLDYL